MIEDTLKDSRPQIPPDTRERMDKAVLTPPKQKKRLLPALAAATTCLLVVMGVGIAQQNNGQVAGSSSSSMELREDTSSAASTIEPDTGVSVAPPTSPTPTDSLKQREVEKSAFITLESTDPALAAQEAASVADSVDGFVLSLTSRKTALSSVSMRVPSERVPQVMSALSEIARVIDRGETQTDITHEFQPVREQLQEKQALRESLLIQLSKADNEREEGEVQMRLNSLNKEIQTLRTSLRSLNNRVAFSTITVSIQPTPDVSKGDDFGVDDSLETAGSVLETALAVLILVALVLIPALGLVGLGWWIYSAWRKRGRDKMLR